MWKSGPGCRSDCEKLSVQSLRKTITTVTTSKNPQATIAVIIISCYHGGDNYFDKGSSYYHGEPGSFKAGRGRGIVAAIRRSRKSQKRYGVRQTHLYRIKIYNLKLTLYIVFGQRI